MKLQKRVLLSLVASLAVAVLLLFVGQLTQSKVLFMMQLPGFYAFASIWGIHSGQWNSVAAYSVWVATNALSYWPIIFCLTFFIRNKPSH